MVAHTPVREAQVRIQNLLESGQFDTARDLFQDLKRQDPEGADQVHAAVQFSFGIDL